MFRNPLPGQRWRHYKGGIYRVIGCARHTEDDTILVVYEDADRRWAWPLSQWHETMPDGKPRFQKLEEDSLVDRFLEPGQTRKDWVDAYKKVR